MSLDSSIYIVFLTLVVAVYWRLSRRGQNILLLAASYFFYAWWDWRFLLLMAASTSVDYWAARRLHASADPGTRRTLLFVSLTLNLCFLGYFKYFNFFVDSFFEAANMVGLHDIPHALWKIILPPAISFYTFQEIAYIVDVYQRKLEPAGSLLEYALFISFFPHLIAGPIQRPAICCLRSNRIAASIQRRSSTAACSSSPDSSANASSPTAAPNSPMPPSMAGWVAAGGSRSSALMPSPFKSMGISAATAT